MKKTYIHHPKQRDIRDAAKQHFCHKPTTQSDFESGINFQVFQLFILGVNSFEPYTSTVETKVDFYGYDLSKKTCT